MQRVHLGSPGRCQRCLASPRIGLLDAMGTMAERLAWRANASGAAIVDTPVRPGEPGVAAQREVATGLGFHFDSFERDGHVRIC